MIRYWAIHRKSKYQCHKPENKASDPLHLLQLENLVFEQRIRKEIGFCQICHTWLIFPAKSSSVSQRCFCQAANNGVLVHNGEMLTPAYIFYFQYVFWSLNQLLFILHIILHHVMCWQFRCALTSSAMHFMDTAFTEKIIPCVPVLTFVILHVKLY